MSVHRRCPNCITLLAGDGAAGVHRGAGVHPLLPPVLRGPAAHPGRAGRDGQEVRQPAPYEDTVRVLEVIVIITTSIKPLSLPQYCFSFSNFSSYFSSLIRKPNLSLLQLIQIVINTVHLEDTNIYLENFISGEEGLFRKYIMTTHLHCICDRADGGGAGRHPRGEAPGQVYVQGHPSGGRGIYLQEAGEHLNCTFCMLESCHECVLHPMKTLRSCLLSVPFYQSS